MGDWVLVKIPMARSHRGTRCIPKVADRGSPLNGQCQVIIQKA